MDKQRDLHSRRVLAYDYVKKQRAEIYSPILKPNIKLFSIVRNYFPFQSEGNCIIIVGILCFILFLH